MGPTSRDSLLMQYLHRRLFIKQATEKRPDVWMVPAYGTVEEHTPVHC